MGGGDTTLKLASTMRLCTRANPHVVIWVPAGSAVAMSSETVALAILKASLYVKHQASQATMSLRVVAMVDASPSFANYRNRRECKLIIVFHMLQVQITSEEEL